MFSPRVFHLLLLILLLFTPLVKKSVVAQVSSDYSFSGNNTAEYHNLILRSLKNSDNSSEISKPKDLIFFPLTPVEDGLAKNLNSQWIWSENTLEIIDSYSPFLFRTKKSAKVDEVKVLLRVNSSGRLIGFDVISEADKGLKERLDYVLRKLPDCKPVPGFEKYGLETFELTIKK